MQNVPKSGLLLLGPFSFTGSSVSNLGCLIGTPRDVSSGESESHEVLVAKLQVDVSHDVPQQRAPHFTIFRGIRLTLVTVASGAASKRSPDSVAGETE